MAKVDLIDSRWVDLVFEGKNQAYGAYKLRKNTGKRNLYALITVIIALIVIAGLVMGYVAFEKYQASRVAVSTDVELSALAQKKEVKVERKEAVKIEKVEQVVEKVKSSVKFTAPVIKEDDQVKPEDELKSQDELANTKTAIGAIDVKGNDEANGEVLKLKQAVAGEPVQKPVEEEKIFDVVEQQPSFPGGMGALNKYLSDNINYPVVAQENGVQGRVIVQFVVGKSGNITNVKVLRSVDPSLDREAVRVVKSMPNWIPGKQNGQAVTCRFTLPVSFRLQ